MNYLTLQETIMSNSIRHKWRMERYLLLGMYNHACGSFRKSMKEFNRSKQLNDAIKIFPIFNINSLADRVAASILRGS